MTENLQGSEPQPSRHYGESGSICTITKTNILESFRKKSYDLQPSSASNDILCMEAKDKKEPEPPRGKCRYTFAFVGFWILFLIGAVRINTSVNIVAMVNQSAVAKRTKVISESCLSLLSNSSQMENGSVIKQDGDFAWSPETQGYILGSYYLGYLIVQIPAGRLVERFGSKWILFATNFITSLTTLLFPVVSWINVYAILVVQLLRGLAQGFAAPAFSVLLANWFTRIDRGFLYTIAMTGGALGIFLSSLFSGLLCDSPGRWPSSFYATGTLGMIISIMILFLVYENVNVHPRISKAERDFILNNQETALPTRRPSPPWCKILTSVPVYAMMFGFIGQLWAVSQFLIVQATFLATILHYPIFQNGFLISITFLVQFFVGHMSGFLSSLMIRKKMASISFTRKFMNFVACLGFSVSMLGVYFAGCDRTLSIIFGILATSFTGFAYSGSLIVSSEMSTTFAGTLCALCLTSGTTACFILPLIVGYMTDDRQTLEQWNKVFFISIGVVMSSGIIFSIFGSAELQPWNNVEKEVETKENDKQTRF